MKTVPEFDRLHGVLREHGVGPDPVVIQGMHRSGTSMLVRVLEAAGVFMGGRLSGNREPRVIQDANRQILDFFAAGWLDPERVPSPDDLRRGFGGLARSVAARLADDFPPCFFEGRRIRGGAWGFKDPRTCVTGALFLEMFPGASAIFVTRNPLDVAASVLVRERKIRRKCPGHEGFEFTAAEGSAAMLRYVRAWETYNERALAIQPWFARSATVRYEDILAAPNNVLRTCFDAIGRPVDDRAIDAVGISHAECRVRVVAHWRST